MPEDRGQKSDAGGHEAPPLGRALALLVKFLEDALQTGRNSHGPDPDFRQIWQREDPEMFGLVEHTERFLKDMGVEWGPPIGIAKDPL